ncbi:cytochrome P450 [Solicola gregarius]|uniref:Cytochrome P450 n=1 Tax=Solicola gregarius TaxID=2908642 RepID=A0AA46TNY2_9ACTN|nr:cytochrome P450 [Solicola gregarius]UYM07868.1 cytochrome P450 [Solicola gregarius]
MNRDHWVVITGLDFDLTDPQTFRPGEHGHLVELWESLRARDHVFWQPFEDTGFWSVISYADVRATYRDRENFTSERGSILDTLLAGGDSAGGRMLAVTDGARHRALRKAMSRFFTPRHLESVERSIARRTARVVDEAVERCTVDFATDVGDRLPIEAVCDLMGVPESDRPQLLTYTKAALSSDDEDSSELDAISARSELLLYLADLVAARRTDPGDDLVSVLTSAEVDGEPLDDDDLALNCYSLILGGDESTRVSAGTGALAFARCPAQWTKLRESRNVSPNLLPTAIEEVLRWSTPSMHFARTATADVQIGEHTIRRGEVVALWNSAANLDPEWFEQPGRFDIDRPARDHLTFGQGRHYCVGAIMARIELRCLFDALCERVVRIEEAAAPRQVFSNFLFGYSSLPLRLHRA